MRGYYSKLQQRFVAREVYFDELLFATLTDENYEKPITNKIRNTKDNIIKSCKE
mgnify:CR=1 FL=1|tara:strand:+ start:575 stop:736 length:162 start_codon:yes stop_codon:yes gene_type:complete